MMVGFYKQQVQDSFKNTDISKAAAYLGTPSARNKKNEMISLQYLIHSQGCALKVQQSRKAQRISAAYCLQHDQEFLSHLERSLGEKSRYENIKREIQALAKLRMIYTTFVKVIFRLRKFRSLSLVFVQKPARIPPRIHEFSEAILEAIQTAGNLGDSVTGQLEPNLSVEHVQKKYADSRKRGYVHAEVQILLHLLKNSDLRPILYMGCSILNCFMCFALLKYLNFKSAGCHYKIYGRWALPRISDGSRPRDDFRSGLRDLHGKMNSKLRKSYTNPERITHQPVPQSPVVSLRSPTNNSLAIRDAETSAYEVSDTWMSQ